MPRPCSDSFYIQLVYEYLLHMGLDDTAQHLCNECVQYDYPVPQPLEGLTRSTINELIDHYDGENEAWFFKVFNSVLPSDVKQSIEYKKMTLDLHVYFAALTLLKKDKANDNFSPKPLVDALPSTCAHTSKESTSCGQSLTKSSWTTYTRLKMDTLEPVDVPVHRHLCERPCTCKARPTSADRTTHQATVQPMRRAQSFHASDEPGRYKEPVHPCMNALLNFLEKECADLRKNPQFLPYFSLPYVVRPQTHPCYNHMFKELWMTSLRRQLWDFLINHRQAAVIPKLVSLFPSEEVHTSFPTQSSAKSSGLHSHVHKHQDNTTKCESPQSEIISPQLPPYHKSVSARCLHAVGLAPKRELVTNGQAIDSSQKNALSSNSQVGNTQENESFSSTFTCDKILHNTSCQPKQDLMCQHAFQGAEFSNPRYSNQTIDKSKNCNLPHINRSNKSIPCLTLPPHVHCLSESIPNLPAISQAAEKQMLSPAETHIHHALDSNHSADKVQARDDHGDLKRSYQHLKSRYNQLHSDYHNLIGVAAELTGALENCLRGEHVDLKKTLNNCSQIFPDLFQHYPPKKSLETAAVAQVHANQKLFLHTVNDKTTLHPTSLVWRLNMKQVNQHLVSSSVKNKLLLLQALRWRITQGQGKERDLAVSDYIHHDMLGLLGEPILSPLLAPQNVQTPHPLQQAAARLLNALASLHCGRNYLACNTATVNVVVHALKEQNGIFVDRVTKDMLVATLQKLSLRRSQRVAMIELDMVEWLVMQLSGNDTQESKHAYSVEYSTALLMNLCLHFSAKQRCVFIADTVIRLLIRLLSTPISQALPYVNGTLYSLLAHPEINQTAALLKLASVLEDHLNEQADSEICKQLEHILHFHRNQLLSASKISQEVGPTDGEMIDDDIEDIDLLEDELDEDDPVRNICGELCGEELLRTHYAQPNPNQGQELFASTLHSEKMKSPTRLLIRPTTPIRRQTTPGLMSDDSEGVVVAKSLHQKPENTELCSNKHQPNSKHPSGSSKQQTACPQRQLYGKKGVILSSGCGKKADFENQNKETDKVTTETVTNIEEDKECTAQLLTAGSKCEKQCTAALSAVRVSQNNELHTEADVVKQNLADPEKGDVECDQSSNQLDRLCTIPEGFVTCSEMKSHCNSQKLESAHCKLEIDTDAAAFASRPKIPRTPPQQN